MSPPERRAWLHDPGPAPPAPGITYTEQGLLTEVSQLRVDVQHLIAQMSEVRGMFNMFLTDAANGFRAIDAEMKRADAEQETVLDDHRFKLGIVDSMVSKHESQITECMMYFTNANALTKDLDDRVGRIEQDLTTTKESMNERDIYIRAHMIPDSIEHVKVTLSKEIREVKERWFPQVMGERVQKLAAEMAKGVTGGLPQGGIDQLVRTRVEYQCDRITERLAKFFQQSLKLISQQGDAHGIFQEPLKLISQQESLMQERILWGLLGRRSPLSGSRRTSPWRSRVTSLSGPWLLAPTTSLQTGLSASSRPRRCVGGCRLPPHTAWLR